MYLLLILVISILPVYLIGLYIYKKDVNKEPAKLLRKLFGYGILICIPAAILEFVVEYFFGDPELMRYSELFVYVLIDVALIEELFKWIVVYLMTYKHNDFDEVYDAIVYAVFVSLGFACFENIFYVLASGVGVGLIRAVTAIPGHAADAIIMGSYLGLAKLADINNNKTLFIKNIALSIIMPVLAHTFYDFCLYTGNVAFVGIFILFVIFLYVYSIKKIKRVAKSNQSLIKKEVVTMPPDVKYCPMCGTVSRGNFCYRCGTKL